MTDESLFTIITVYNYVLRCNFMQSIGKFLCLCMETLKTLYSVTEEGINSTKEEGINSTTSDHHTKFKSP